MCLNVSGIIAKVFFVDFFLEKGAFFFLFLFLNETKTPTRVKSMSADAM